VEQRVTLPSCQHLANYLFRPREHSHTFLNYTEFVCDRKSFLSQWAR